MIGSFARLESIRRSNLDGDRAKKAKMSNREVVLRHLSDVMRTAFTRGDMVDAQNIDAYLRAIEGMTDEEYEGYGAEQETREFAP